MFSSKSDEWETPRYFFDALKMCANFTLDPAATDENHMCDKYYTLESDGLKQDWSGHVVYVNPPYSKRQLKLWVKKGYEEGLKPNTKVIMLIPARVDTKYWHEYVMRAKEVYFVEGRLKFNGAASVASFPSAVVVFEGINRGFPEFFPMSLKEMKKQLKEENSQITIYKGK